MKTFTRAIAVLLLSMAASIVIGCDNDNPNEEPTPPTPGVNSENGALKGLFTVSDGRQVRFSQGNLQYQGTTKTWRFADQQWYIQAADNNNISDSYDGWIDLFGWGTSGYNKVEPYTTTFNLDYYVNQEPGIDGTNYDWGIYNPISNAGNQAGQWFTLSIEDWDHILNHREGSRYAKAVLDGVKGLVLLPDVWDNESYPLKGVNNASSNYDNNLTVTDWVTILEANGAVFLPAGGFRQTNRVYGDGEIGRYWSTSHHDFEAGSAYDVCFDYWDVALSDGQSDNISNGNSVRLVRWAD